MSSGHEVTTSTSALSAATRKLTGLAERLLVSSEASLEGKLFVEFVALIYLSYIKKRMQEKKMFKDYTMIGLLDELDVIECFQQPGKALFVGEILNRQKQLYEDLGVQPPMNPASLC